MTNFVSESERCYSLKVDLHNSILSNQNKTESWGEGRVTRVWERKGGDDSHLRPSLGEIGINEVVRGRNIDKVFNLNFAGDFLLTSYP